MLGLGIEFTDLLNAKSTLGRWQRGGDLRHAVALLAKRCTLRNVRLRAFWRGMRRYLITSTSWFQRLLPQTFAKAIMKSTSGYPQMWHCTRVPCEIPVTLASLDPARPFFDLCLVVLVSPQGCAARFYRPLEIGSAVRLEGLPTNTSVTARVVNCIAIGSERFWMLGLVLQEPGNVWGIQSPPQDWLR